VKKKVGIIAALSALLVALSAAVALAVAPGTYSGTVNPAFAPNGTHFAGGTSAPHCVVDANLNVTCGDGTAGTLTYQLAGVGNTNATATLSAVYAGTVVCFNGGGNPSDSQHQGTVSPSTSTGPIHSDKNGRLVVPSLSVNAPTRAEFEAQQTCPNPNWTPRLQGEITLQSFTYTLHFADFTGNYIVISA
jgi:hypothetical protein